MLKQIIIYLMITFLGYAIGRIGHIFGGQLKSPHHWIYGIILIIVGLFLKRFSIGFFILSFGLGLFVSDLKDFIALKFYGKDEVKVKRFWGID
jgi:hypothetical protein